MSIQDASLLPTEHNLDKIIVTDNQTFSVVDAITVKSQTFITTGVTTNYEFVGIYSIDGGTTWTDLTGSTAIWSGFTAAPSVEISGRIDTDGTVRLSIDQRALINGGSNWTLLVKIAYMFDTENTSISSSLLTTDKILYDNQYSYMKVAVEGSTSVSSASAQTTTIAHGLGYIPVVSVRIKRTIGKYNLTYSDFGLSGSILNAVRVDSSNIYVSTPLIGPTQTIYIYYKIYYEEQ